MGHPIHTVTSFKQLGTYVLRVLFDDGTEQVIDFEPILRGKLFGPLKEPEVFRQVRLDRETGTLVWPNGADFDPYTLHDWPRFVDELTERARSWEEIRT
ncbi:MAG: DUF2442 domain-containing protein [Gemmatimonadota bacterium]